MAIVLSAGLFISGCGRDAGEGADALPATPAEAAARVDAVFASEDPVVRETAAVAAEAVRTGSYEKAVVALQTLKERPGVTLDQGLAVHGSMVALEAQLIQAADAGDENAKRAYELLRRMKRH